MIQNYCTSALAIVYRGVCLFGAYLGIASSLHAQAVSVDVLDSEWNFHGHGLKKVERGMLYMKEEPGSQGAMIVSPEAYASEVNVRYEIMPMNAASVCVLILGAIDADNSRTLSIPEGYDGSMGHWIQQVDNTFFAFHNAAHNRTPFAIRFPDRTPLGTATDNVMQSGRFYTIAAGRTGNRVWLEIDGTLVFEGKDTVPSTAGHIAFRIRGLAEEPAACLIRNVSVESTGN
ncbi:MAG: hypothetical protein ACPGN3_01255 [Opitutales bacterium]